MSDRGCAGGWRSPEDADVPVPGSRYVCRPPLLWKHPVSAAEVFPVQPSVLQAAPVAAGTGFSRGRHSLSLIREGLLESDSLLRFLLFQQLLFLLCKAGQVQTIVFPMENPVLRECYRDAAQSEADNF